MKTRRICIRLSTVLAFLFCAIYGTAAILVSLHRFWQYEVFYYDFGIFDTALWQLSRFLPPLIDHLALGRTIIFADHMSPTIFLLSPVFWFTSKSEMLLVIQALAVTLSGWVLFKIGNIILQNKWLSFGIMISYLLFVGIQNAIITDFHEVTVATLPLMLTFWAIAAKKKGLYVLFFILTLGCKESMFTVALGIGIFLLLTRQWRQTALLTIFCSIIWGAITTKFLIPLFSQGIYLYAPQLPNQPLQWITGFLDEPDKRRTLWYSFRSFSFFPLFAPTTWPLLLSDFAVRFLPKNAELRWTLGMHYNAIAGVLLSVSSLYGLSTIMNFLTNNVRRLCAGSEKIFYGFTCEREIGDGQKKQFRERIEVRRKIFLRPQHIVGGITVLILLNTLYLHQRELHGPLGLSYNKAFYAHSKDFAFLDALVAKVPKNASVMTQNNLAVRFTHQTVYLPDMNYQQVNPDYIVLDLRDGQNPNDFFGSHAKSIEQFVGKLISDPKYSLITDPSSSQKIWRHK
jgi:uncharacterized membrane protein